MRKTPSREEQEKIVKKAEYYYSLVGGDFGNKINLSAMAMAIGWARGKLDSRNDSTQTGILISNESELLATMITCAHSLAMDCETMKEAFLDQDNEEAA